MERGLTCGLRLPALLLLGCGALWAFNLDDENVVRKSGEPGSLFGFSLAMHRQLNPDKRLLLVGAPQAKALSRQKSKVTGGLYHCDLDSSDCTRVQFDNDEDLATESKENQWMGVTVKSQGPGGKIVTCAHRWQRRSNVKTNIETRDIIGRCYVLNQYFGIDLDQSDEGGSWHFCENRPRGHEMFGSCQQGLSATFDKDFHYVIFGAPGAYNWKGIVRLEQKNATLFDLGFYDDGPFEAGDENEKNPDLVPAPPNSYLGFSLDSGKFLTKKNHLTVVAGAPRANYSGGVVLLKKGPDTSTILLEEYTLQGEGLASSFGYDLTVLDLNGDGWQDIVVGAPQYFEKDGDIGGAIYVYVNKAGKWNKVTPTRIEGPKDSMFGLAVENLGDINRDKYEDFAVGAPYEDDGAGKVYIYHGSKDGLKSKDASQVLSGKSLGVKQFGYSLAGNMDLDMNQYPDLAVGSLTDSVFVFKARPVIEIKKKVKFTPQEIDLTKKNCENNRKFCMEVQVCFTYTANPASYAPKLTVVYTLEADADHRKIGLNPRAAFIGSEKSYESVGVITMANKGKEQCVEQKLVIEDNIKDKLRGLPIDVSVDIQDSRRKRRQTSELQPVLGDSEPKTIRSEVNFLKEGCGTDKICQSNLKVEYRYGTRTDDTFKPLALVEGVPMISLSDQKEIALEVKVSNPNGDDAHEASVEASFPRALTYSTYRNPDATGKVTCLANKNGSMVDCDIGNPFKRDSEVFFYIILGTSGISLDNTELEVLLQPKTTSTQLSIAPVKAKARVAIELPLYLSGSAQPSQVQFSGEVKGISAMKTESDIGSEVTHQFRIVNLGKSLKGFGTATLHIRWPKETKNGKWLLYLMKITSSGVDVDCSPQSEIHSLKKELSNSRMRRAAENKKGSGEGVLSRFSDRKFKTLSCDKEAKCVTIKCPLRGLESNAVITLHSRLWNSTFIEDYSDEHHVDVMVNAFLRVDGKTNNTVVKKADAEARLQVYPERRAAKFAGSVPWWIIVLSILFGLMLLALLAFLLWKCGFFKRAKYEDRIPSYSAVRIKRDDRATNPGTCNWETVEKKPWMTTWHDKEHYS